MLKKKILLVEDDYDISDILKVRLEKKGFQIIRAWDGIEAVKRAREHPDLIILDLGLPKLNGLSALKKIKSDKSLSFIPVVVLTGKGDSRTIFDAMETGSYDYLIKPVNLQDMVRVINKAVYQLEE